MIKFADKIIKEIEKVAKEKINEAEKITFIGYSLPSYDKKYVEELFKTKKNNIELEIVDYEENENKYKEKKYEIMKNYKEIFPNGDIKINLEGFEKYIESI